MAEHNCNCNDPECGCGHDHDAEEAIIYLTLEDDEEVKCNVISVFEVDEKEYIALLPEGDDQVLLYGFTEDEDGIELLNIDDDEEFSAVSEAFLEDFEEDFDFEEDEEEE